MLTRIVTGTLAAAVALAAILWREPWGVVILAAAVLLAGSFELYRLAGPSPLACVPVLALVGFCIAWYADAAPLDTAVLPAGVVWLVGAASLLVWKPHKRLEVCGLFLWVAVGSFSLVMLQLQSRHMGGTWDTNLLLMALVPLWVGDSLAYFVGKAFGRHKLAPSISPNKTWEGAVANLVGCLAAAYAIGLWLEVPLPASIAVGLTTGILGQVGDLLQSRLKRLAEVKDSGSILPGHGGVLDRLDSFLFSSYPSLLALYLLAPGLFHVKHWPW